MMIKINAGEKALLLEALEDLMYKISMQSDKFKGQANTKERKAITQRQKQIEALQHSISIAEAG